MRQQLRQTLFCYLVTENIYIPKYILGCKSKEYGCNILALRHVLGNFLPYNKKPSLSEAEKVHSMRSGLFRTVTLTLSTCVLVAIGQPLFDWPN